VLPRRQTCCSCHRKAGQHLPRRKRDGLGKKFSTLKKGFKGSPQRVDVRRKVWEVLAQLIEEQDTDLLVVGTHGRTGIRQLLMGSIAEEIFRRAHCPVLSVGPNVLDNPEDLAEFHQILLATDSSEDSLAAAPYAISLAQEHQAQLYLLQRFGAAGGRHRGLGGEHCFSVASP